MPDSTPTYDLTEREFRFVAEYVADPRSAARAYQRAYDLPYTNQSAREQASKLLRKPGIIAAIDAHRIEWSRGLRVNYRTVIRKLASIALGDADDYYTADNTNNDLPKPRAWNQIPPTARKNIKAVKFKRRKLKSDSAELYEVEELEYKVADQEWALGKLCEYLGITKGSLTVDELRNIIAGPNTPQNPPPPTTAPPASGTSDTPILLHPDE